MKKFMNIFVLVAAAAMALASCQKPEIENVEPQEYEYTFLIGSADTKATVGETCVEWEKDDKMGVYAKTSGGEISYNAKGFITPAESGESAIMQVYSFKPLAVDDMIYTYYPYTENNSNVPTEVALSIPALQDGKDDMPMVSIPLSLTSSLEGFKNTPVEAGAIKLVNLGSVIEFNVYTETDTYASEVVKSVTFEADKALAGGFAFDLTRVDYSKESTLSITNLTENTVVANVSDLTVGTKANPAVVKMVVAPGTYKGSVVVKTDAAIYTFPISIAKEFKRSAVKPLNVNLANGEREIFVTTYPTLTSEEIQTKIAASACSYGVEKIYDDVEDGVIWTSTCYTSANGRPWLQMKKDAAVYIAMESTSDIKNVIVTVTNATNSSGGVADIAKHGAYEGNLSLNTSADGNGVEVAKGPATDNKVVLTPNGNYNKLYLKTDAAARIWNIQLTTSGTVNVKPAIGASDISVSARGVEDAELEYTLVNPDGSTLTVTCDGEVVTSASVNNEIITYSVAENITSDEKNGAITISYGDIEKVVSVSQKGAVLTSTQTEIVLAPEAAAKKSFTITSDFDWATVINGTGFTISPESYIWAEGGKQSVTVTATSENTSEAGLIVLGTIKFISDSGQEIVVTVKQESSYVDESLATATLTFDDINKRTVGTAEQQVWTENYVTFTNNKSTSTNDVNLEAISPIRCYASSSILVEMTYDISEIEFNCETEEYATNLSNSITDATVVTNKKVTVKLPSPSTSFTIPTLAKQVRLYSLTVKYSGKNLGGGEGDEGGDESEPSVVFYESFDSFTSTGGNDGKFNSSGSTKISIKGWTFENAYNANACIKLGGGSTKGSATTPALGQPGDMTLTFKAAAWNKDDEKTTLKLSVSNGGALSISSVEMSKTEWTEFKVTISGATASTQIKFEGYQNSSSRFFLDEVKVVKN